MNEKITLVSALCIAISCLAAALVWVVKQWQMDKNKHIADKDVLIKLVKENTESTTKTGELINSNIKSTDLNTQVLNNIHQNLIKATKKDKRK